MKRSEIIPEQSVLVYEWTPLHEKLNFFLSELAKILYCLWTNFNTGDKVIFFMTAKDSKLGSVDLVTYRIIFSNILPLYPIFHHLLPEAIALLCLMLGLALQLFHLW